MIASDTLHDGCATRHTDGDGLDTRHLRILHLEDDPLDAELAKATIAAAHIPAQIRRVQTEAEFRAAIECPDFDLILADYALPTFDGLSALAIAHRACPDIPFIFVSGTLGEEIAIDSLKDGATDYVLKQRLKRLPFAINRAMAEAVERARRQRAEREMIRAKEDAERANNAKDYFFATLSHELRTPLNPVLAAASILDRDEALPAEMKKYVRMIRRNAEVQARLIDDLLDLTRIAKGKIELHPEETNVHTLLARTVEICQTDIDHKSLTVKLELAADCPLVTADAARLQQVFWNVLRNAIKYTPARGTIVLRTRNTKMDDTSQLSHDHHTEHLTGNDPDALAVVIAVKDSGIGFDPDAAPRLFNAFVQADSSITRKYGGLGLGLAIAKAILDAHHGQISAHSDGPNKGATFTIRLPALARAPHHARHSSDGAKQPPRKPLRGLRILLLEDHADTMDVMRKLLATFGHEVTCASTVAEALAVAPAQQFDLVISDIGLPDGTGVEFLQRLHAENGATGKAPVPPAIALSGYGMEQDIERCKSAGFAAHLTKPVNIAKLEATIETLLRPESPAP